MALADTNNPTMNNPACSVCHAIHDPVAGTFQNYGNEGWYRDSYGGLDSLPDTCKYPENIGGNTDPSEYQHSDTWFRDMRAPSFEGRFAPRIDNAVQWMVAEIADDPRFAAAAVKFWWPVLMGALPVLAPEVSTDVTFTRQLDAFEAQNTFIEELGVSFASGIKGRSAFSGKDMLVELMMSHWFRADRAVSEADRENYVVEMGTRRLLSPEELEAKGLALFG
ncbi:MAG: hypothetical protein ACI8Z1_002564 [Candidatus Azotimanducaceae bacterium]